jgi:hypothetical protein
MPHTKEYKGKKGQSAHHGHSHKRRPRHEMSEESVEAVETEEAVFDGTTDINTEAQNEGVAAEELHVRAEAFHQDTPEENQSSSQSEEQQKIHLEFYGSDIIRMKAPQLMELADTVADEWVKDGEFQGLPVGNPIAQLAAAKALRKAKDVEKKLEEKGVFVMAKMGLDYLKSKIEKR